MALWDKLFKKKDEDSAGFKPIVQKNPPPVPPPRVSSARPAPKPVAPSVPPPVPQPQPVAAAQSPDSQADRDTKKRKKSEGGTKSRPKDDAAFVNRGLSRQSEGDHDGAIEDFTKAIELNPNFAKAYAARGVSREAKGDGGGAKSDYSKALQIEIMSEISRQMRENPDVEM
jgi:tetratricopeptide (TPR) repeat protein